MLNHIRFGFWALRILWGLTAIKQKNRYLLWRKSLRLYAAFLAFTDPSHPPDQLYRAMVCALVSAVYDYCTDWVKCENPETSLCFSLLGKLLKNHPQREQATALAQNLFRQDWAGQLSADGLKRGSVALRFYVLVIGSQWMAEYSAEKIDFFGRELQIVDDFLDLEEDRAAGDTNCFLTSGAEAFRLELLAFLESEFFRQLETNSRIYRVNLRQELKLRLTGQQPLSLGKLFVTSRPQTGLYGAAVTLIGFRFYQPMTWLAAILASGIFLFATWSIMSFNDWTDRLRDRQKDKTFANDHPKALLRYCFALSGIVCSALTALAFLDLNTAILCFGVWVLGLLYSTTKIYQWYGINNMVVAFCSATPALVGPVYQRNLSRGEPLLAVILFLMVLTREVYLDTRDAMTDKGYKATIPAINGHRMATLYVISMTLLWTACLALYPNPWIKALIVPAVGLQFMHVSLLNWPQEVTKAKRMLDWVIQLLLTTLLITQ